MNEIHENDLDLRPPLSINVHVDVIHVAAAPGPLACSRLGARPLSLYQPQRSTQNLTQKKYKFNVQFFLVVVGVLKFFSRTKPTRKYPNITFLKKIIVRVGNLISNCHAASR